MTNMETSDSQAASSTKFHWLFLPGEISEPAIYNTILKETQHFAVLPTKGAIVPGWVLVVPKFPITRIADVPTELRRELRELVNDVSISLESKFGNVYTFEHGGLKGSKVSCGVDQAHLHIAPLAFDLLECAHSASSGGWNNTGSSKLPEKDFSGQEYWFASSGKTASYKVIEQPCSQFFRKLIAREVGKPTCWDYKTSDFLENVERTVRAMGANG